MKTTVIHHSADFDGLFCREIARKFLPEAELIGWDYGNPKVPMPTEGTVYILDLSPECLADMPGGETAPHYDRMVWIDHHKSAIEKFSPSIYGYRIDGVAACRLAWQWFSQDHTDVVVQFGGLPDKQAFVDRNVAEPYSVRLAGEYDIWDKRNPDAELFQHGLRSQELSNKDWGNLLPIAGNNSEIVQRLLTQGKAIQFSKTKENESIIKSSGFTIQFEGFTLLACNAARYNSQLFAAGLKPEHDGCLGFNWDGKQWKVSLYTDKPGIDLSVVAVKHGGGGHRGACGFRADKLPFLP